MMNLRFLQAYQNKYNEHSDYFNLTKKLQTTFPQEY